MAGGTVRLLERFSDLDAVFLAGETPTQHLHVLATLVLDRSPPGGGDYELFQARVAERFHLIEPLRRRLRRVPLGRPAWVDDPHMHLQRHLHHVVLAEGGGIEALARTASDIASYPLPQDRPLWEVWFVDNVDKNHTGVVAKIHHCAVDGVSGIYALAAFFDGEAVPDPTAASPPDWKPAASPRPVDVGRAVVEDLVRRPQAVARGLVRAASSTVALARRRGLEAPLPFTGPRQSYNRTLTARRSVAFTSIPLEDVKRIRTVVGASVNDVLVALCAGVLRRYAVKHDELPDRPLVAGVPVSERTAEHGPAGNQLSFMFYGLPVHLGDPRERLEFVKRSATAVKDVYARAGQGLFAGLASLTPTGALGPLMRALSGVHAANTLPPVVNVLISNIRGPETPMYVAGAEVRAIYPMGPLIEGVGLGVTAISYRDEVDFGFMACAELVPDIHELTTGVHIEVARMLDAVAGAA